MTNNQVESNTDENKKLSVASNTTNGIMHVQSTKLLHAICSESFKGTYDYLIAVPKGCGYREIGNYSILSEFFWLFVSEINISLMRLLEENDFEIRGIPEISDMFPKLIKIIIARKPRKEYSRTSLC